ncbi:hypothetical protein ACQ7B2_00135, partial [Escherichia coli]
AVDGRASSQIIIPLDHATARDNYVVTDSYLPVRPARDAGPYTNGWSVRQYPSITPAWGSSVSISQINGNPLFAGVRGPGWDSYLY